jgi:hypothetical protein
LKKQENDEEDKERREDVQVSEEIGTTFLHPILIMSQGGKTMDLQVLSHVKFMTKILVGWCQRRDTPGVDLLSSSLVNY